MDLAASIKGGEVAKKLPKVTFFTGAYMQRPYRGPPNPDAQVDIRPWPLGPMHIGIS